MSAKTEKELRYGIKVCEELVKRQSEIQGELASLRLRCKQADREREATQQLLLKAVQKMEALEEWRKEHILQDMLRRDRLRKEKENLEALVWIRRKHVERVRRAFGWASAVCFLLMLGLAGGLECGNISFGLAVTGMILCACGGFVFACKAGVMTWE